MPANQYSAALMQSLGQILPPGVVSTGKPGELYIEGVGVRKFAEMRQDPIFDRVQITPASVPAGTTFEFFSNIQGKKPHETNMRSPSALPDGHEALVYRINFLLLPDTDGADKQKVLSYGYGKLILDEDNTKREGPIITFPSAYDAYGGFATTKTDTTLSVISSGIPSPGAQPRMMIPVYIAERRTFRFELIFHEAVTLTATTYAYVILDSIRTKPATG